MWAVLVCDGDLFCLLCCCQWLIAIKGVHMTKQMRFALILCPVWIVIVDIGFGIFAPCFYRAMEMHWLIAWWSDLLVLDPVSLICALKEKANLDFARWINIHSLLKEHEKMSRSDVITLMKRCNRTILNVAVVAIIAHPSLPPQCFWNFSEQTYFDDVAIVAICNLAIMFSEQDFLLKMIIFLHFKCLIN